MSRVVKLRRRLRGVVAQEVHRFAHLADGVGQGFARFAHDQPEQVLHLLFERVGCALQAGGALAGRGDLPDRRGALGAARGFVHFCSGRLAHPAHLIARIGGVEHGHPTYGCGLRVIGGRGLFCDGRRRVGHVLRTAQQRGAERGQLLLVRQIQPGGIQTRLRAQPGKQLPRQGNTRMRRAEHAGLDGNRAGLVHGVGHQFGHGNGVVADAVDERGIGAVFKQASHQIGQQGVVRSHRGVDAAGAGQLARADRADDLVVQRLAHAVQTLKLVLPRVVILPGHLHDGRHCLRVVRGELRIGRVWRGQQFVGAG